METARLSLLLCSAKSSFQKSWYTKQLSILFIS